MSLCMDAIHVDTEHLLRIEQEQNRIRNLPEEWPLSNPTQEMRTIGFHRKDLHHYGHLIAEGKFTWKVNSRRGIPQDNQDSKRYFFLMEEIFIVCLVEGHNEGWEYERSFDVHFGFSIDSVDSFSFKIYYDEQPTGGQDYLTITCNGKPKDVQGMLQGYSSMRANCMIDAGNQRHNCIPFTFPVGSRCDVCGKLLRGCFRQGYVCANFSGTDYYNLYVTNYARTLSLRGTQGCYKKFHKYCIERAGKCPRNKFEPPAPCEPDSTPSPAPWDAGYVHPEDVAKVLEKCPVNTFMVTKIPREHHRDDEEPFVSYLCHSVVRGDPGVQPPPTEEPRIEVHQREIYQETEGARLGYHIQFLFTGDYAYSVEELHQMDVYGDSIADLIQLYQNNAPNVQNVVSQRLGLPVETALKREQRRQGMSFYGWLKGPPRSLTLVLLGLGLDQQFTDSNEKSAS